jgi:hypothetical protein
VIGGDSGNVNVRTTRIAVLGPSIPFASFSFSPTAPAVLDAVTFDANGSSLDGSACGSACSYSWNFDDGSSGSGLVLQHTFTVLGRVQRDADGDVDRPRDVEQHDEANRHRATGSASGELHDRSVRGRGAQLLQVHRCVDGWCRRDDYRPPD